MNNKILSAKEAKAIGMVKDHEIYDLIRAQAMDNQISLVTRISIECATTLVGLGYGIEYFPETRNHEISWKDAEAPIRN